MTMVSYREYTAPGLLDCSQRIRLRRTEILKKRSIFIAFAHVRNMRNQPYNSCTPRVPDRARAVLRARGPGIAGSSATHPRRVPVSLEEDAWERSPAGTSCGLEKRPCCRVGRQRGPPRPIWWASLHSTHPTVDCERNPVCHWEFIQLGELARPSASLRRFFLAVPQQVLHQIVEFRLGDLLDQVGRHWRKLHGQPLVDAGFHHANFLALRVGKDENIAFLAK